MSTVKNPSPHSKPAEKGDEEIVTNADEEGNKTDPAPEKVVKDRPAPVPDKDKKPGKKNGFSTQFLLF